MDAEYAERALHVPTRIVLDETVIPKRYARVLLHAIYLDTVDLTLILRGANSGTAAAGSLGEVHALTAGRTRPTPLEEAMELYQIGRFLELDILAQGCEDLILEWLTLDTLPTVLKWGSQVSVAISRIKCNQEIIFYYFYSPMVLRGFSDKLANIYAKNSRQLFRRLSYTNLISLN